ncbi:MAG: hypothetical protein IJM50_00830 [Lachnospiraceae bacterium]|nr:hypothetical protein [Lachnospiraceae bacterium]
MRFDHRFVKKQSEPGTLTYQADGVTMRVDMLEHMLRVSLVKKDVPLVPTWSVCPKGRDCPLEGRDKLSLEGLKTVSPNVTETDEKAAFTLDGVRFEIELKNFRITARNGNGILYQDRDGLAYNFEGELGDGSVHFTRREEEEKIFGLGDKCGGVNKAGGRFVLGATDAMGFSATTSDPLYKQVPFFICENAAGSYGLYYDTYSNGTVDLGREHDNYFQPFHAVRFEEENMVFYLILGSTREIVRRFAALCGKAAPVPEWAFYYCGSTMEYTDALDSDQRLKGFIEKCEENGIRAGGFYLSSGYTQIGDKRCVFHWNTDKIPSPEGLAAHFKAHGLELMPNVKPAFLTDHPLFDAIAEKGLFLKDEEGRPALFPFWGGMAAYLDFTNPEAYAFWKEKVRTELVEKGYCNIWNDNNEYDVWDANVRACGFGHALPARRIRPLFSYLMARASREACEEAGIGAPFNISRCAVAGTQRVASTWQGDNLTAFEELRYNHFQAMTLSLSGFLFFGPDIGGFAGPQPDPELFMRWIQYGVFLPRFVLHSWKPGHASTMPWLYPELLPAVRRLFSLREKMVPYLYKEAERCRNEYEPLICPIFLREPGYDTESDCFFVGSRVLACPVFDKGKTSVEVLLPEAEEGWRLRGEGEVLPGSTRIVVPCPAEDEPVWFSKDGKSPW